jgi:ABC-type polysaccharide/polyol phosphate export permease
LAPSEAHKVTPIACPPNSSDLAEGPAPAAGGPDEPDASLRFHRRIRLIGSIREVWGARALVRTLAERDMRARYKQAALGFGWAMLTPLLLMVVFTVFFQRAATVDTGDAPYALYAYLGLLPWTFFSSSVSDGALSMVTNNALLNKVYCPREVFPLASIAVAFFDTLLASLALGIIFVVYGYAPRSTSVWAPVLLLVLAAWTVAITLIVSVVTVYLRDLRHALPVLLQVGIFATPVAYGMDKIPGTFRTIYGIFNPLGPVIDGLRRCVLYGKSPDWDLLGPAAIASFLALGVFYVTFKRLETGIADVA